MALNRLLLLAESVNRKIKAKEKKDREELEFLVSQVLSRVEVQHGRDGKDAPSLEEIMQEVRSLMPEPKIIQKTTVQQIKEEIADEKIRELIKQELPEPTVPEIRIIEKEQELDTSGFLTKDEFKKALRRIDQAIQANKGGGGFAAQVRDDLTTNINNNKQEIDELTANLSTLIDNLLAQGASTQDILQEVISSIDKNRRELELLNARTEEAFETSITKEDLEN